MRFLVLLMVPGISTLNCQTAGSAKRMDTRAMVAAADSLFNADNWRAAAERYQRVLETDPSDATSALNLGQSLYSLGDWKGAAYADSIAAARSPVQQPVALMRRARAFARMADRDGAMRAMVQSLQAGYLPTAVLATDPAFDSLRTLPAFQAQMRKIFGPHFGAPQAPGGPSPAQIAEGIRYAVSTIRIRHPNPYRYLTAAQWDSLAADDIARASTMTEQEFFVEMVRLVSEVGDVHTAAFPGKTSGVMQRAVPLMFWKFPEGVYIRAADSAHRELLGARVLGVAGTSMAELWPRLIREFPFENEWMAADQIPFYLRFPDFLRGLRLQSDSTRILMHLQMADGREREVMVPTFRRGYNTESGETRGFVVPTGWLEAGASNRPLWLRNRASNYWLTTLPDHHTVYMQFNLPRNDAAHPWDAFLDTLVATVKRVRADRLIIDLRHNPGGWGYTAYDLSWRLRDVPEVNRPGHFFVLLSRVTQSAGLHIAAELERNANAIFVGEPLAAHPTLFNGRLGNHVPQSLPGTGVLFRVSEVVQQHSDPLDPRRFIAPDLPAPLTWEAFRQGTDPALEVATTIRFDTAARLLDDDGGRALPAYFRWNRPTQFWAYGSAGEHPIP